MEELDEDDLKMPPRVKWVGVNDFQTEDKSALTIDELIAVLTEAKKHFAHRKGQDVYVRVVMENAKIDDELKKTTYDDKYGEISGLGLPCLIMEPLDVLLIASPKKRMT